LVGIRPIQNTPVNLRGRIRRTGKNYGEISFEKFLCGWWGKGIPGVSQSPQTVKLSVSNGFIYKLWVRYDFLIVIFLTHAHTQSPRGDSAIT
jgi:hypothetical protein